MTINWTGVGFSGITYVAEGGGGVLGESTRWADVADFASLPTEDLRDNDRCRTSDTGWLWQYNAVTESWNAREVFVLTQASLPSSNIEPGAIASVGSNPMAYWEQSAFVWDTTQWVRVQEGIPFVWDPIEMSLTAVTDNFKTAGDLVAALPGFRPGDRMVYNNQTYVHTTIGSSEDKGGVGFTCWLNQCMSSETVLGASYFDGTEADIGELNAKGIVFSSSAGAGSTLTFPGTHLQFNVSATGSRYYLKTLDGDANSSSKYYIRIEGARTTSGTANIDVFAFGYSDSGKAATIYSAEAGDFIAKTGFYNGTSAIGSPSVSYGSHTTLPTIASGNFDVLEIIDNGRSGGATLLVNGKVQNFFLRESLSQIYNYIYFGAYNASGGVTLNTAMRNALFVRF